MNKDRLDEEISRFLDAWMAVRQLIQATNEPSAPGTRIAVIAARRDFLATRHHGLKV